VLYFLGSNMVTSVHDCRHTVVKEMTRKRCYGFSFSKLMSVVCNIVTVHHQLVII